MAVFPLTRPRRTALLGAAALVAAGCSMAGEAPSTRPEPAYVASLGPALESVAEELLVTGAVVLVRSREAGDWTFTIGRRARGGTEPVRAYDRVRVGSNTKTWTGTVILQLVQEGRLSLDDPIARFRPDVPGGDRITIGQLLSMRSGLGNYTEDFDLSNQMDIYPTRAWKPDELLAKGFAMPPVAAPGTSFHYSNTNTVLLGVVIEQITGNPVAEEFQQRLFTPLGMTATTFPDISSNALGEPHARGYTYGTNVGTLESLVLPPDVQAAAAAGVITPMDVTTVNPSWGWTAGAGISTAEDLARWVEALAGGGLLNADLQRQRLDSVVPTSPDPGAASYGLGLARFGPFYGHSGELPGYNSFMGHDPQRGITVVTWATPAPAVNGAAPAVELARVVIGALAS